MINPLFEIQPKANFSPDDGRKVKRFFSKHARKNEETFMEGFEIIFLPQSATAAFPLPSVRTRDSALPVKR